MRFSAVSVIARVKEVSFNNSLPVTRTKVTRGEDGRISALNEGERSEPKQYKFSGCQLSDGEFQKEISQIKPIITGVLSGISCGIIGLGLDNTKPGSYSSLLSGALACLGEAIPPFEARNKVSVIMSFGFYGITDTSCIDLLTYSRLELARVKELRSWNELSPVDDIQSVIEALDQGYSLPCVIMIHLFVKGEDASVPGALSSLLLADLGSMTGASSSLEKSLSQLKSQILSDDAPSQFECSSYLSMMMEGYFGGSAETCLVAEVPSVGSTRALTSYLNFLEAVSAIRNTPTPTLESPEMIELSSLAEAHGRLEIEHKSLRRELRHLKKALKASEEQQENLQIEKKAMKMASESQNYAFEYELARVEMERLQVQERIRQCEIDLLCMEQEKLFLIHEMEVKKTQMIELEMKLHGSQVERIKVEKELTEKVSAINKNLAQAQEQLANSEGEKSTMKASLADATLKIQLLEKRITQAEKEKEKTAGKAESQASRLASESEQRGKELERLRSDLDSAKRHESNLSSKMKDLEVSLEGRHKTVQALESQLGALKMENTTLQAKLEILTNKTQSSEVSKTLQNMEEKWKLERESMQNIMNDLRSLLKNKNSVVEEPTPKRSKLITTSARAAPISSLLEETTTPAISAPIKLGTKKGRGIRETDKGSGVPIKKIFGEAPTASIPVPDTAAPIASGRGTVIETILDAVNKTPPVSANSNDVAKEKGGRVVDRKTKIADETEIVPVDSDYTPAEEVPSTPPHKGLMTKKFLAADKSSIAPAKASRINSRSKKVGSDSSEPSWSSSQSQPDQMPPANVAKPEVKVASNSTSPVKIWKPSAFIPGLAQKAKVAPTSDAFTNSKENSAMSFLANMSFSQTAAGSGDHGFQRRIKLPEKNKPSLVDGMGAGATKPLPRRNVDPNVYSTILSSFNIPGMKK